MGVRVVRSEDRTIRTVYDPCPARFEVMIGGEQQLGIDGNDELIFEFRGLRLLPFRSQTLGLALGTGTGKAWSISR